jgi:hypothetical protein
MEKWKAIKGLENLYEISNLGRVKSITRTLSDGRVWKGRILKTPLSSGYPSVSLRANNSYIVERVHRLVAFAFKEGYKEGYCVNHLDGNKHNNNENNLEWCTRAENNRHARKLGLNDAVKVMRHVNSKKTVQLSLDNKVIKVFKRATEAAIALNCSHQIITRVCRGERSTAKGYKWAYLEDYEKRKESNT